MVGRADIVFGSAGKPRGCEPELRVFKAWRARSERERYPRYSSLLVRPAPKVNGASAPHDDLCFPCWYRSYILYIKLGSLLSGSIVFVKHRGYQIYTSVDWRGLC